MILSEISFPGDNMTKVKICGIKNQSDVEIINRYLPDFAGFVMFYPKSCRNVSAKTANALLSELDNRITPVAVVVSPDENRLDEVADLGFSYVQIHGDVSTEKIKKSKLPVFKAFNVSDLSSFKKYASLDNVKGFVFDAGVPGSGETFDWKILKNLETRNKLFFLAGGLSAEKVTTAISVVHPDAVDVSSGVELDDKSGKDEKKVKEFIDRVRTMA